MKALAETKAKISDRVKERNEHAHQGAPVKLVGREPKEPETGLQAKDQIKLTDAEPRIMPSVNAFVQAPNDKRQVEPTLKALHAQPDCLGKPETRLADNSSFSKDNIQTRMDEKIVQLIALGMKTHHLPLAERLVKVETEPETNDQPRPKEPKIHGCELYGNRKSTVVEPVRCLGSSNRCRASANCNLN